MRLGCHSHNGQDRDESHIDDFEGEPCSSDMDPLMLGCRPGGHDSILGKRPRESPRCPADPVIRGMCRIACRLVRSSLKLGLLIVSVTTLIASWDGAGSASPPNRLTASESSVPVQSGYEGNENFCAQQPLNGTLAYRVSSGRASIRVALRGLPKRVLVGIDWSNNAARGYLIGTIRSDGHGGSIPGSEKLFRPPESRGYKVILTWPTNKKTLGTMWPCGSPVKSISQAETLRCERGIEARLPMTAAPMEACMSGRLTVRHLCPPPSNTIFVIWRGRTYVLSEGRKPIETTQAVRDGHDNPGMWG